MSGSRPGRRRGERVGGHVGGVDALLGRHRGAPLLDRRDEVRVERPEVRAGRRQRVVPVAGRRRARVEPLRPVELLPDEQRPDGVAGDGDPRRRRRRPATRSPATASPACATPVTASG